MKKIKIELSPDELASIIHIVGEKEKEIHHLSLNKNISLGLIEKLTVGLNDSQKESTIKVQVKGAISRLTGIAVGQMKDDSSLSRDLNMTSPQIRSLAIPFTYIARQYKPVATISPDDCEMQDTIQECVDLIIKKTK